MKALKNNAFDVNTWHQVSNKMRNSDYDRMNENRDFIERVKAAVGKFRTIDNTNKRSVKK